LEKKTARSIERAAQSPKKRFFRKIMPTLSSVEGTSSAQAGLLAYSSNRRFRCFRLPGKLQWRYGNSSANHSGGTARESHPLPYSPGEPGTCTEEYSFLEINYYYTVNSAKVNR